MKTTFNAENAETAEKTRGCFHLCPIFWAALRRPGNPDVLARCTLGVPGGAPQTGTGCSGRWRLCGWHCAA